MNAQCKACGQTFTIEPEDLKFYKDVSPRFGKTVCEIPPPTHCPLCRMQRRFVWRSELHLYKRKSDLTGKPILSYFPQSAPCKVYTSDEWWSDAWSPFDSGRDFDFNRPFFEQFKELIAATPVPALSVSSVENCDYINCASWMKNCYLIAGANHDEDCYYGNFVNYSKDCADCSFIDHCELCYECVDCAGCYDLKFSDQCTNCSSSAFLFSCRGCKECFGSVNLMNKQYVFFNEQLSAQDYRARIAALSLNKRSSIRTIRQKFDEHKLAFPHRAVIGEMNDHVSGNCILRSKNTTACFDVSDLEDCKYCVWFHQSKNAMDCYSWGFPVEQAYECFEVGDRSYQVAFSATLYNCIRHFYCFGCRHSSDCFGCVSMKNAQYCILNKQYSKEEYEELVPKIIEHMRQSGEYGEFFPMSVSPLAYNQTIAQDYYPLSEEQAIALGARWNRELPQETPPSSIDAPDDIHETPDTICEQILRCETTGKPYKIIPQELKFYKRLSLPLPGKSFMERHLERLKRRNPRQLWQRSCDSCQKKIETSYAPERVEKVFCEECYLAVIS
ncbi:MAG: hypothetical protein PHZ00_01470 [Candidatus Peribacteraceae bacterium]|nr:hypothetical protein [Candidatus Peribacteraceae bacterium]